jgi:transposase
MKNKDLPSPLDTGKTPVVSESVRPLRFSDEFKRSAVLRLRQGGQSATSLAVELGIRRNLLYKWAKKFDEQAPEVAFKSPGRPPASQESEIAELRRQLADANEELAILKKFDAYLTLLGK